VEDTVTKTVSLNIQDAMGHCSYLCITGNLILSLHHFYQENWPNTCVRFGVLRAVVMKSTIFWDITPCSPLKVNRRLGGSNNKPSKKPAWKQVASLHTGFLLGLVFHPEDGGDMFLRNVGWFLTGNTALYPRRYYSSWPNTYLCNDYQPGYTERFCFRAGNLILRYYKRTNKRRV
jgi:hypothetical protein